MDLIAATGLVFLYKIGFKSLNFFTHVTWKFAGRPWKTIGRLFYATSSFVFHFIAICQCKMELQSGNAQSGSKSAILQSGNAIFGSRSITFFVPVDLEIWRMTLKNNRAPLQCYFKLCASFHSHLSIQNGVTVRKRPIWVKIDDFLSHVTLIFDGWPKTAGHLFYSTSSFVHHFMAICQFKTELLSGNAKFGSKLIFCPVWPWNLTDDLEKH